MGALSLEPLADVWPRGEDAITLPDFAYAGDVARTIPAELAVAMEAADVTGVVPVVSPRRRWGDIFLTAGMLGASFSDDDAQAIEALACQLAVVLDSAELLDRTVRAERSLAHAEKLAAIGELAARMAQELTTPSLTLAAASDPLSAACMSGVKPVRFVCSIFAPASRSV